MQGLNVLLKKGVMTVDDVDICELCLKAYESEEVKGVRRLKEFDGYTVDFRLRQFRKLRVNRLPEFIDFTSKKGRVLLLKMHNDVMR